MGDLSDGGVTPCPMDNVGSLSEFAGAAAALGNDVPRGFSRDRIGVDFMDFPDGPDSCFPHKKIEMPQFMTIFS